MGLSLATVTLPHLTALEDREVPAHLWGKGTEFDDASVMVHALLIKGQTIKVLIAPQLGPTLGTSCEMEYM